MAEGAEAEAQLGRGRGGCWAAEARAASPDVGEGTQAEE